MRNFLLIILFTVVTSAANAQFVAADSLKNDGNASHEAKQSLGKRLNAKLSNKYYNTKYDTNYVVRPNEKWLLRILGNYAGNYIHAKGNVNDVYSKYDLHTRRNTSVSLEVNYCDIAVALSLNPDKIKGIYDDYELNLEYHGNMISLDFNYLRATSLTGDVYHFSPRYLGGASLMMSNSLFDNDKVTVNQNKWIARAFFGMRF